MTKEEMKNRISMTLKDPVLQQGFEIICKESTELKTKKIPQLERKIASIRGAHSVDCKKLNARIEQVERLKKENAELKELLDCKNCCELEESECGSCVEFGHFRCKGKEQITKAKLIITLAIEVIKYWSFTGGTERLNLFLDKAEQFLNSEVKK